MFVKDFPVENLHPATYNPRDISEEALELLRASISEIGMVKPIIVTDDSTIIAGHQRTKALLAIGLKTTPAYLLRAVKLEDEITFNQLHNGTDMDTGDEGCLIPAQRELGYVEVKAADIRGNLRAMGAPVRTSICRLIGGYGAWGAAVANQSGEVINSAQYALACKTLGIPCRVYVVPDDKTDRVRYYLSKSYGKFYYGRLKRATYIQTFAQPFRFRTEGSTKGESDAYEKWVIPELDKARERLLDFGCGQGDYLKRLQREGFRNWGIEFFFRSKDQIDTLAVHRMCDLLAQTLEEDGLFDAVIMDFVLNSVDSKQAESDVFHCINALAKPGARVYFSGRSREVQDAKPLQTYQRRHADRKIEFLDEDGFSGIYFKGHWFYQMFHTEEQYRALTQKYLVGENDYKVMIGTNKFSIRTIKSVELPVNDMEASLEREFDLMWPGGKSVGRAKQIIDAWHKARARSYSPEGLSATQALRETNALERASVINSAALHDAEVRAARESAKRREKAAVAEAKVALRRAAKQTASAPETVIEEGPEMGDPLVDGTPSIVDYRD